jgi:hypothetical protein
MSPRTRLLNYSSAPCPLWTLRVPSDVCYDFLFGGQKRRFAGLSITSGLPPTNGHFLSPSAWLKRAIDGHSQQKKPRPTVAARQVVV